MNERLPPLLWTNATAIFGNWEAYSIVRYGKNACNCECLEQNIIFSCGEFFEAVFVGFQY